MCVQVRVSVCHHTLGLQWPFGVPGILVQHGSVQRAIGEQHDRCRLTKTVNI